MRYTLFPQVHWIENKQVILGFESAFHKDKKKFNYPAHYGG